MTRVLPALLLLGVLAASLTGGCLEPFRVRVDPQALGTTSGWIEVHEKVKGKALGAHTQETRYTFDPTGNSPPFPGTLQVFSVRSLSRLSEDKLLALANDAVEDGATSHAIQLDGTSSEGRRTLAHGVKTHWVLRSGVTTEGGSVFDDQVRIHILAEVGHDGKSDTSFLAVAIVQVERAQQCPVVICNPIHSDATWIQVVGDPDGSVEGTSSTTGFIDNLVTH